ncbi:MAG: urease accessory UreF family protein, partial [Cyanobacteria bacterium P01_A01_bin.135]
VLTAATPMVEDMALLRLLQLTSPALPVGGYSYSEGLETLSQQGQLPDGAALEGWLIHELAYGTVRVEATMVLKVHQAVTQGNPAAIAQWNRYLSALRDTEELRQQNWQMGQSLRQLLLNLESDFGPLLQPLQPCNFAIAFAVAAAHWDVSEKNSVLGYLYSWTTTLVNAGIKLVPLGQTAGQQLQQRLHPKLIETTTWVLSAPDSWWDWTYAEATPASGPETSPQICSWGVSLASMGHEALYSRLFRS